MKDIRLIDCLHRVYNFSTDIPYLFKTLRFDSILRHVVMWLSYYVLPAYYYLTNKLYMLDVEPNNTYITDRRIIVSLTSFPRRIGVVWQTIESLFRQTIKPDKIILWLSNEQFSSFNDLPKELQAQTERGLEIRFVDGDFRSHKKYLYAFQEFPHDYVVLVDDDILYPSNFINQLMDGMSATRVHCSYGSIMTFDKLGKLQPYVMWKHLVKDKSEDGCFFFGSGGGTVLVPSALYKDVCDIELATYLCPTADDVWLNAMCRLAELKIVKVRGELIFPIYIKNNQTLYSTNVNESYNDLQIMSIRNYYLEQKGVDPFVKN